ncbi:hypothetical protein ACNS7O_11725 [Haloferacaceae archaeon DSL9]
MSLPPPSVPEDRLAAWEQTDETTETVFRFGLVSVTARTLVYEDETRRERFCDLTGSDFSWRFFFASRLRLRPEPATTAPLLGLVADRAATGFVSRLRERGFERIRKRDRESVSIDDSTARLTTYAARCPLDGLVFDVVGLLAVWSGEEDFRLAGGAYPLGIAEGGDKTRRALAAGVDPDADRAELLSLVRAVR